MSDAEIWDMGYRAAGGTGSTPNPYRIRARESEGRTIVLPESAVPVGCPSGEFAVDMVVHTRSDRVMLFGLFTSISVGYRIPVDANLEVEAR